MNKFVIVFFILVVLSIALYTYVQSVLNKIAYNYKVTGLQLNGRVLGIKMTVFITNRSNISIVLKDTVTKIFYKGAELAEIKKGDISVLSEKTNQINIIADLVSLKYAAELITLYTSKSDIPLTISFYGGIKGTPKLLKIKLNEIKYTYQP